MTRTGSLDKWLELVCGRKINDPDQDTETQGDVKTLRVKKENSYIRYKILE